MGHLYLYMVHDPCVKPIQAIQALLENNYGLL